MEYVESRILPMFPIVGEPRGSLPCLFTCAITKDAVVLFPHVKQSFTRHPNGSGLFYVPHLIR